MKSIRKMRLWSSLKQIKIESKLNNSKKNNKKKLLRKKCQLNQMKKSKKMRKYRRQLSSLRLIPTVQAL